MKTWTLLLFLIWLGSPSDLISETQTWEAQVLEDLHRGHLDSARNLARQALQNPAAAGTAQEFLGRIAIAEKQYEDALSHLNLAQSMGRASPELHEAIAAALQKLGRYEEALPVLKEELRRNPTRVDLRYQLAESLLALDKIREAQPHLEAVYEQGLRHAGVLMQLARARFASGSKAHPSDVGDTPQRVCDGGHLSDAKVHTPRGKNRRCQAPHRSRCPHGTASAQSRNNKDTRGNPETA